MFCYWPCLLPLCQEKGPGFDEIPESRLSEFLAGMFLARSHWGLFCLASDLNTKFTQAVFVEWSFLKSNDRKKREGKVKERRQATCSVHSCRFPGETPNKAYSPFFFFFSFLLHFCIHSFCIHCHPLVVPGSHLLMPTPPLSPAKSQSIEEPGPCHLSCPSPCEVQGFREPVTFPPHLRVGSCGM